MKNEIVLFENQNIKVELIGYRAKSKKDIIFRKRRNIK